MNLVEAIDAWIDARIDELTDDDLDRILEIHDAVSASEFADLETSLVYDDDIVELAELTGGDEANQAYTEEVLRSAFYDEPMSSELADDGDEDTTDESFDTETLIEHDSLETNEEFSDADLQDSTESRFDELADDQQHDDHENDGIAEHFETDTAQSSETGEADPVPERNASFLEDLAYATTTDNHHATAHELADDQQHDDHENDDHEHDDHENDDQHHDDHENDGIAEHFETDTATETAQSSETGETDPDPERNASFLEDLAYATTTDNHHATAHELADDQHHDDHENDGIAEHFETDTATESDQPSETGETDPVPERNASFLEDLADATTTDGFMADLAVASALDESATTDHEKIAAVSVRPVEFSEGDELGPSFLPPSSDTPQRDPGAWKRWTVTTLLILGLAVFVFGTLQLLTSLSEEPETAAVETNEATPTTQPTATSAPEPTVAVAAAPIEATEPTPTPEATPAPRVGIRLVTGDVMLATFNQTNEPATLRQIYNAANDDLAAAVDVGWINDLLVVVDTQGDVLLVDPDTPGAEPTRIFEAGDRLGSVLEAVALAENLAIRTDNGDIALLSVEGVPDDEELTLIWDANEQEAEATDIASDGEFVAFVLDDGTARFVATADADESVEIWDAADETSAFNVDASPGGILLGIGQGIVAQYALEDDDVELLWDPVDEDDVPAIGYSNTGDDRVAIVLDDGTLLLVDEEDRVTMWDPADTEIAALAAVGDNSQLVVLLETGSVLRIPLDSDFIESVWDITDETLSAANQVTIEPAAS